MDREALREMLVVLRQELSQVARGGRLVALAALTALGALLAAAIFTFVQKGIFEQAGVRPEDQQLSELAMGTLSRGLAWLVGGDETVARALTEAQVPPLMLFSFWLSRLLLPLLAVLLCYDALAGEFGTRSIRFVLLRARRGAVLVGKALAQLIVLSGLIALASAVVLAYGALRLPSFQVQPALGFLVPTLGASIFHGAAYVALVMVASAAAKRGGGALLGALLLVFGLWLLRGIAVATGFDPLRWVLPGSYENLLVAQTTGGRLQVIGAYGAFTLAYMGVAWAVLRRRDL